MAYEPSEHDALAGADAYTDAHRTFFDLLETSFDTAHLARWNRQGAGEARAVRRAGHGGDPLATRARSPGFASASRWAHVSAAVLGGRVALRSRRFESSGPPRLAAGPG